MSQHIYRTEHPQHGRIEIMAGWDRPLQGYFLCIERLDAPEDAEEEAYLYNNLDDMNLPLGGMSATFSYFERVLERLGIRIPGDMAEDIRRDAAENMGNKQRDWSAA